MMALIGKAEELQVLINMMFKNLFIKGGPSIPQSFFFCLSKAGSQRRKSQTFLPSQQCQVPQIPKCSHTCPSVFS